MAFIDDNVFHSMAGDAATRKRILRHLEDLLSQNRLQHSIGVAKTARSLAHRFGADPKKAYTAGMAHDIARELGRERILDLAGSGNWKPETWQIQKPLILHGYAGAVLLKKWGLKDPDILAAVEDHVTGRPGMSLLSQIVFAADYLEPGRSFLDSHSREVMLEQDLDKMTMQVLKAVFQHFEGNEIAKPAMSLYHQLKIKKGKE